MKSFLTVIIVALTINSANAFSPENFNNQLSKKDWDAIGLGAMQMMLSHALWKKNKKAANCLRQVYFGQGGLWAKLTDTMKSKKMNSAAIIYTYAREQCGFPVNGQPLNEITWQSPKIVGAVSDKRTDYAGIFFCTDKHLNKPERAACNAVLKFSEKLSIVRASLVRGIAEDGKKIKKLNDDRKISLLQADRLPDGRAVFQSEKNKEEWFFENGTRVPITLVATAIRSPYLAAQKALKKGNYAFALKVFSDYSEKGFGRAQYNLGTMYYKGQGTPIDVNRAIDLWYKAEQNRNQAAIDLLKRIAK